jgi:hypothetical protein
MSALDHTVWPQGLQIARSELVQADGGPFLSPEFALSTRGMFTNSLGYETLLLHCVALELRKMRVEE